MYKIYMIFTITDSRHIKPILMDLKKCNHFEYQHFSTLKDNLVAEYSLTEKDTYLISFYWLLISFLRVFYLLENKYYSLIQSRLETIIALSAEYHATLISQLLQPFHLFYPINTFLIVIKYYLSLIYGIFFNIVSFFLKEYVKNSANFFIYVLFISILLIPILVVELILSLWIMIIHEFTSILLGTQVRRSQFIYRFVLLYGVIVLVLVNTNDDIQKEASIDQFIMNCIHKILN